MQSSSQPSYIKDHQPVLEKKLKYKLLIDRR